MSEAARWRQKARAFEQRENWKRAIEAYEAAMQEDKRARRDTDLSLYNRVGDLYRRVGDVNKAVQFWEAAADGHISAGFYNNAIALCNKVLRNQPNRHSIYLKLGKIGAAKGFLSDARKHFLEYAERAQKADQLDKAFSALIEFADISPDPEIRILIADQLLDHNRSGSAIEQLRLAWRDLGQEGREAEAEEVRARIIELNPNRDPEVDPPEAGTSTGYEDAVGVIDLPELEPLPLVDPGSEGARVEAADDTDIEADLELQDVEDEADDDEEITAEELIGIMPTALTQREPEDEDLEDEEEDVTPDESLDIVPTMFDQEPEGVEEEPAAAGDSTQDSFLAALDPSASAATADEELDLADSLESVDEAEETTMEEADEIDVAGLFDEPDLETPDLETPDLMEPDIGGLAVAEPEQEVDRVAELRSRLEAEGEKPELLVELADALLERGDRQPAIECLREALAVYDEQDDLEGAGRVVSELLQLDINDIGAHQKRVELALRAKDPARLTDAYVDLADCLDRTEAGDKARAVYSRVLELDPQNARARAALDLLGDESKAIEMPAAARQAEMREASAEFVDLASLVTEEEAAGKSTRFTVPAVEPQSEGEVNFSEMLSQFKSKVAEAIEEEDAASHYDLGVAYKEMGLLDEAIAEFQIAARGMEYRLRAVEMLGSCFLEKGEYGIALKVLNRALQGQYRDEELVGIFYGMGLAFQELGEGSRALDFYERVMGCDMHFADVAERVDALRH